MGSKEKYIQKGIFFSLEYYIHKIFSTKNFFFLDVYFNCYRYFLIFEYLIFQTMEFGIVLRIIYIQRLIMCNIGKLFINILLPYLIA